MGLSNVTMINNSECIGCRITINNEIRRMNKMFVENGHAQELCNMVKLMYDTDLNKSHNFS